MGSISYNVRHIPDKAKLLAHLHKRHNQSQLKAILFYRNEIDFARLVKATFPDCVVILRNWPDDSIHNRMSPEAWLAKFGGDAQGSLALYTTNEPGFSAELINWHIRLMEIAPTEMQLCMFNFGVGQPQAEQWPQARKALEIAVQRGHIIGLHEYAGGVITSGFLGGWPDNAGVAPNSGKTGVNLTRRENWPTKEQAKTVTMFHVGRWHFLRDYCKSIGLALPKIVITEHGFDFTQDIGDWLMKLPRTEDHVDINGWKTLEAYWRKIFPDWDKVKALFEQVHYANEVAYDGVLAQLVFDYADDPSWLNYHVYNAIESYLEHDGNPPVEEKPTEPPNTPPPTQDPPPTPPSKLVEISRADAQELETQYTALARRWHEIASR